MFKLLLISTIFFALTACEKEKQTSASIGTVPKQIIDKATNDINKATALAAEKLKAAETQDVEK